jgi:hypothetical protein
LNVAKFDLLFAMGKLQRSKQANDWSGLRTNQNPPPDAIVKQWLVFYPSSKQKPRTQNVIAHVSRTSVIIYSRNLMSVTRCTSISKTKSETC